MNDRMQAWDWPSVRDRFATLSDALEMPPDSYGKLAQELQDIAGWIALQGASKAGQFWACPTCGCTEIEGQAWVNINEDRLLNSEPPSDHYWCPQCDINGNDGHFEKGCDEVQEWQPITEEGTT
jgi:hypothetical protein